jgi:vancomycin aglycone glucosyltransferase
MRVLLSTIGSRGDIQPVVALAVKLRELGQEVRICAPPDFREWVDTLGISSWPSDPRCATPHAAHQPRRPRHRPSSCIS